jgi:hypothetical protein
MEKKSKQNKLLLNKTTIQRVFKLVSKKDLLLIQWWRVRIGRHDTPHNDTQHKDSQLNDTQNNDTHHNDTQHYETHHNDTQNNDTA